MHFQKIRALVMTTIFRVFAQLRQENTSTVAYFQ
jgi:hypothetical protein